MNINKINDFSKSKRIYEMFLSNPNNIFDNEKLKNSFNFRYNDKIDSHSTSTVLSRLFKKNRLIRTPTQLKSGYYYSLSNKKELDRRFKNHLLSYDFKNKEKLIGLINKNNFKRLKDNIRLDLSNIKKFDFIKRYGLSHFDKEVIKFLVLNVGFLMCDGHLDNNFKKLDYFFFRKRDGIKFIKDFKSFFKKEHLNLRYTCFCYHVKFTSKSFAKLMNVLGVPMGNKVFQAFLIPDWIYYGPDEIKKIFLSIVIGNEGSKPQDSRWRIQFVLSKNKENIENLLIFLNQIRSMLSHFGISTSHIQLRKQKGRQFNGRFYIKGKENLVKFYKILEFSYASEKQEVLESLILNGKS